MMSRLSFQEYGSGKPIILLHGFPFSKEMWKEFAPALAGNYKVYTVDLPGFGDSKKPLSFSLPVIAGEILDWIRQQSIPASALIGHSLGGYIALSMADQSPAQFAGLGLFHSTALADSEEKKQSRDKVLEFIDRNGPAAFTSNSVLPLFADKNHPAIPFIREISAKAKAEALKGYTVAMRDRKDTQSVLKNYSKPVLFIVGKEDPGIPVESIEKQSLLCSQSEVQTLDRVGHMGMFEAKSETLAIVRGFLTRVFSI